MKLSPSLKDLIAINLQYDAGTEALSVRAIGQLLAKLLFARGRLVSARPNELAKEAAKVLRIAKISHDQVGAGLAFLRDRLGFAKESRGAWLLTDTGYSAIETDVRAAEVRVRGVLGRHFPPKVRPTALARWFNDACVAFYSLYGSQWAAALGGSPAPARPTTDALRGLLKQTISSHGLAAEAADLEHGFNCFLFSQEPEDVAHHWSLSQALLAARIVAANLGPDPVTARELRGTVLLLDTNMLLVTTLEGHRHSTALEDLGNVLLGMGVTLAYIEDTRAEYTRVVSAVRTNLLRAVESYPMSVLEDSTDDFARTALDRGCKSRDDFEVFCDGLLDPPTMLGDKVPISLRNDDQTLSLAERGRTDQQLTTDIVANWKRLRPRSKKSQQAAEHDAALTTVTEGLARLGVKCAVLTLDRTMHDHAMRRAGIKGLPQWISLDALIQILAVYNTGPDFDPADFAPLFAEIIRHQCEPILNSYTVQDLAMMLDVDDRCADLNADEAKAIAIKVARERLQGKDRRDPELALLIRRGFQSGKFKLADELVVRKADLRTRDDELVRARQRGGTALALAVSQRTNELRRHSHRSLAMAALLALVGSAAGTWVSMMISRKVASSNTAEYVGLLVGLLGLFAPALWWFFTSAIPKWRESIAFAPETARQEIEDEIQNASGVT